MVVCSQRHCLGRFAWTRTGPLQNHDGRIHHRCAGNSGAGGALGAFRYRLPYRRSVGRGFAWAVLWTKHGCVGK